MKKWIKRILVTVVLLAVALHVAWFAWREIRYGQYTPGMEPQEFSTWIVPRYCWKDEDGYDYSVKYPDYLSLTGNLAVGSPAEGDDPFTDALIIWPKWTGGYGYGLLLYDQQDAWQVEIDQEGNPLDPQWEAVVEAHREQVDTLLDKAKTHWVLD